MVRGGKRETLCWRCTRPGTGTCSWDKRLEPVEGWTAEEHRFRESDGSTTVSWCVLDCPLYDPDPDYAARMDNKPWSFLRAEGKR